MTTVIMLPGRLMGQGTRALVREEAVPVRSGRRVVLRRAAREVAFLQSLDQAT